MNVHDLGEVRSGNIKVTPGLGNFQRYTNNGPHIISRPTAPCAVELLITNGPCAGAVAFRGFETEAGFGDAMSTREGDQFVLRIRRPTRRAFVFLKIVALQQA